MQIATAAWARAAPMMAAIAALLFATAGGLARLGVLDASALATPTRLHAALMVSGFLGTVISLERAVALRRNWALAAPLTSAAAALLALAGADMAALLAWPLAATLLLAASIAILRTQDAAHTRLLTVAAAAWLAGHLMLLAGTAWDAVLLAWFDFLIVTIAAERLELTRLMRRRPIALPLLAVCIAALLAGTTLAAIRPAAGHALHGAALIALACWLLAFDLARRTLRSEGLARYAAVCLLGGYAWLAVAGGAQLAQAAGVAAARDLWLHALGLGFVLSMIFGHAPIILPAVARLPIAFGGYFYVPLALLHASLLLRFAGAVLPPLRVWGAVLNAITLALFIAGVIASARRGRRGGRRGSGSATHV
jgi:hypothetical protein